MRSLREEYCYVLECLVTLLTNSCPVLSYHHTINGTHTNPITPCKSCHTHMILGTYPHLDTLVPQLHFPFTIVISHVSCISPTHNSHSKYNSSHMLYSNSDPAPLHYVIFPHFITLASSLSLTPNPHSHWCCCALFWYKVLPPFTYSTCSNIDLWTIAYSTYQSLVTLVTLVLNSDLWTLALHSTLCSSPLGSLNLRLNSIHWTLLYHKLALTSDFNSRPHMKYLDLDSRYVQRMSWSQPLNPSKPKAPSSQ